MKAGNTLVQRDPKMTFGEYINGDKVKNGIIARFNGDAMLAARFIATITAAVNATPALQDCDNGTIVQAALTGEVGMNLSYALGQYGIIPYGSTAKFQLQVNGLKQLCIRSKAYAKIDCFEVYDGEFKGRDPRTREPIFEWIEDEDAKLNLPIVGYYAFYVLNDQNNNFFNCIYWSHEKILQHADRYAQAFNLAKYRDLLAGKLPPEEVEKLQGSKKKKGSSPWYANPNDDPHIKMCKKTVLKQLLNDGLAPKSIQDIIVEDDNAEREAATQDDFFSGATVDDTTGEVVDEPTATETTDVTTDAEAEPAAEEKKSVRRGRPPKTAKETDETPLIEAEIVEAAPTDATEAFDVERDFFGDAE